MKLANLSAVVTGAASGLGLACARQLTARGVSVVIADLSEDGVAVAEALGTIAPGIFDTPLLAKLPEKVRAALGASVPHPPPSRSARRIRHDGSPHPGEPHAER